MSRRRRRRSTIVATIACLSLFAGSSELHAADAAEGKIVPPQLVDVRGGPVDAGALASAERLFFVTLKATWCPVCREQLRRLRDMLPRLRSCGATFVVLAPGPRDDLARIADESGFPYPFVEDAGLSVARSLDLALAPDQIEPAIFEVDANRRVVWIQRGRSGASFGDQALLERLKCDALQTARVELGN